VDTNTDHPECMSEPSFIEQQRFNMDIGLFEERLQ
jgi:hypothetical protein